MPTPIPDLSRDQQCHHYQAPSGQRCCSPALKGQMIYGLQVAMRALEPPPSQRCSVYQPQYAAAHSNKICHPERTQRAEEPRGTAPAKIVETTPPSDPPAPATIPSPRRASSTPCARATAPVATPNSSPLTNSPSARTPVRLRKSSKNPYVACPLRERHLQFSLRSSPPPRIQAPKPRTAKPGTANLSHNPHSPPALLYTHLGAQYP